MNFFRETTLSLKVYKKKNVVGYNEINKWQGQVHIIDYTEGNLSLIHI